MPITLSPDMSEPGSTSDARLSFLIWIAEVDAVIGEASRIGAVRGEQLAAALLARELRAACERAQDRLLARKAFHFRPSISTAPLAKRAIDAARRGSTPALADRPPGDV